MTTITGTPPPARPARPGADRSGAPATPSATPGALSWMWDLDLDAVLAAATGTPPWAGATRPGPRLPHDDRVSAYYLVC
jgi:hypothetical protein